MAVMSIGTNHDFVRKNAPKQPNTVYWAFGKLHTTFKNVVSTKTPLTPDRLRHLAASCEMPEGIVLDGTDHLSDYQIRETIRICSQFSPILFARVRLDFENSLRFHYDEVNTRGVGEFFGINRNLVRENCFSYISQYRGKPHTVEFHRSTWKLDGRPLEHLSAFNVLNILMFDPVKPEPGHFYRRAAAAYEGLIRKGETPTDMKMYNTLFTPQGIVPIDMEESRGVDYAGVSWDQYVETIRKTPLSQHEQQLRRNAEVLINEAHYI